MYISLERRIGDLTRLYGGLENLSTTTGISPNILEKIKAGGEPTDEECKLLGLRRVVLYSPIDVRKRRA